MPLLKAKLYETDLRSKPFGFDRPNGGSSNQPYIVSPIPTGSVPSSPDFLLRNGYLNFINSLTDAERIGKWFIDTKSPNGLLFTAKQELLERQNVDVNDGINRIYNPLGTEAQVGVVSIGYHLNKQGFNVFRQGYYDNGENGYFPVTKKNEDEQNSRLQLLYQVKRVENESSPTTIQKLKLSANISGRNIAAAGAIAGIGTLGLLQTGLRNPLAFASLGALSSLPLLIGTDINIKKINVPTKLANKLYSITGVNDDVNLISYPGGPGSFLGIGKTNIRIWNPLQFKNYSYNYATSNITKNEDQSLNPYLYLTPTDGNIVGANTIRESILKTSKTSFSRKRNGQVKILNPNLAISSDLMIPDEGDIIDFYFELINNDGGKNTKLPLRAYIEDFSDSFTGEWDAYKYMGRAESFYRYKGFTRDFSLSFIIPTLSRTDLIANYQKLNALTWLTMPDYSDKGYIRGNLAYLTIGNYLERAVIVMKSISFAPIMEMGFDINRDESYKIFTTTDPLYTGQLPKGIKVQCSITPLTQMTGEGDNKELFYTPQRGEAFIGNRIHAIKDRPDTIGKQYVGEEKLDPVYQANDPENSGIFTTGNPDQIIIGTDSAIPSNNPFAQDFPTA